MQKYFLAFFLICLVFAAPIQQKTQYSLDINSFTKEVNQLSLQLLKKNSAQSIQEEDQISLSLEQSSNQLLELNEQKASNCQQQQQQLENDLLNYQQSLAEAQSEVEQFQSQIALLDEQLNVETKLIAETDKNINDGEAKFDRYEESSKSQLSQMLKLVDSAIQLVELLESGVAYSEIQSKFVQISSSLDGMDDQNSALFKPIVKDLTQLSSTADREFFDQTLTLLSNLRSTMADGQDQRENFKSKQNDNWKSSRRNLDNEKRDLGEKRNELIMQRSSIQSQLEDAKYSYENERVNVETTQESLNQQKELCSQMNQTFKENRTQREIEEETVQNIKHEVKKLEN